MQRTTKIALVFAVALWGMVGALHNFLDWNGTLGAVGAATSMSTFEGGADAWQATSSPVVVWLGALFIVGAKIVAAIMCLIGGGAMWQSRGESSEAFAAAKRFALSGCGIAAFMLFTGFIVIAESWYELWRSDVMRGPVLESAFRYGGMILLIAIFVAMPDE